MLEKASIAHRSEPTKLESLANAKCLEPIDTLWSSSYNTSYLLLYCHLEEYFVHQHLQWTDVVVDSMLSCTQSQTTVRSLDLSIQWGWILSAWAWDPFSWWASLEHFLSARKLCSLAVLTVLWITHATELVLDSPGFCHDFWPSQHLLDSSSCHVVELNVLNILKLNSNPPFQWRLMVRQGTDLDALIYATHTQLQARE